MTLEKSTKLNRGKMKKLELKDIAGYIPYGLYIQNYELGNEDAPPSEALAVYGAPDLHHLDVYGMEDQPHLNDVRPVLRSLSDLTREITHKGEKFVPIVALAKILGFPCQMYEDEVCGWSTHMRDDYQGYEFGWCQKQQSFGVWYDDNKADNPDAPCVENHLMTTEAFDLLNEWMFDYRDLIGQGLAIDVNTLKENCYE